MTGLAGHFRREDLVRYTLEKLVKRSEPRQEIAKKR